MKEGLKFLGGALLAAALLWVVLRDVDPRSLWEAARRASIAGLLLGGALNFGHNVFRVWRWQALLAPVRPGVRFRPAFVAVMIGYATSWIIPGRLGELVRPALLSAREDVPVGPSLGSVIADRMLDGAAMILLFAVGLWLTPLEGPVAEHARLVRAGSMGMLGVIVILLAILLALATQRKLVERWVEERTGLVRWVGRLALSLSEGVLALRDPRLLTVVIAHSILAWVTICAGTWTAVRAVGADVPLGAIFILMPMLALGVAVPTPGGAGSYHAAMKYGLMLFGVAQPVAVSAGLWMHVMITVPVILIGVVFIKTEKLVWSDMLAAARRLRSLGTRSPGATSLPLEELS